MRGEGGKETERVEAQQAAMQCRHMVFGREMMRVLKTPVVGFVV